MRTYFLLWLEDFQRDVRCGIRNLRRYPGAALVAVASLAAGIGATSVTLTIRNAVFHKPPETYRDPSHLSRIHVDRAERRLRPFGSAVPGALFGTWSDLFGPSIAASTTPRGERDLRTHDRTIAVPYRAGTPNLFRVLGAEPVVGRTFDEPGATTDGFTPVVLSYRIWQRAFDARPDVVGQTVWLDAEPHTVIGVMPERFWYQTMNAPVWTSIDPRRAAAEDTVDVVMRRSAGTTPADLAAQLQRGLEEYEQRSSARLHMLVSGVEGTPVGHQVANALPYVLGMSAFLTLLIACANVATLMIAQWTSREQEIAIRASIGASRWRIVRSLLTESVMLSMMAGALGLCATFAIRGWMRSRGGEVTFIDLSIDPSVVLQTLTIAMLTGIVAGVAPALYETGRLQANPLRGMTGADRVRQRWRHALVVFEIAVTMALVVTASAMIDGYQRARRAQVGFSTSPLMALRVEDAKGVATSRVLEILDDLPGVAGAAASTSIPLSSGGPREPMATDAAGTNAVMAERADITSNFFDVLGVRMRAGRPFSAADASAARVAIASEALAAQLFAGRTAVGETVWIGSTPYDIIGVAADYSGNPLRSMGDEPRLFLPLARDSRQLPRLGFLVRAESDPAALVEAARRQVRDDGGGTVLGANTLDQTVRVIGAEILVGTAPLFPLIAIGMVLTSAGIYGVLAFALTRRARELAIRVAIGATGPDLARLVAMHTLRLVLVGSALGLTATFALVAVVRFGGGAGSIFDPPVQAFLAPLTIVLAIGAITTWLPARRASKVDPVVLLRSL
jgi:putative ABC transport system permease protein